MKKRKPGRPRKVTTDENLPFEVKIEKVQLTRTKNNPQYDALKIKISSLEKGEGFEYPKQYHNTIQGIMSKLHRVKNGPAYGTVQKNSSTRILGRVF